MNANSMHSKTVITVCKLIKGLELDKLKNKNMYLRIIFSDVVKIDEDNIFKIYIKPLSLKVYTNDNKLKDEYDMSDVYEIFNAANIWIDTGKQLRKTKISTESRLQIVNIDLKPQTFINDKLELVKWFKVNYQSVKQSDKTIQKQQELEDDIEAKEEEYYNSKMKMIVCDDEDDDENDKNDEVDVEDL